MAHCTSYHTRPFCRSCQFVSGCGGVRPSRPASILDWWWVLLLYTASSLQSCNTHTHTHVCLGEEALHPNHQGYSPEFPMG